MCTPEALGLGTTQTIHGHGYNSQSIQLIAAPKQIACAPLLFVVASVILPPLVVTVIDEWFVTIAKSR